MKEISVSLEKVFDEYQDKSISKGGRISYVANHFDAIKYSCKDGILTLYFDSDEKYTFAAMSL